MRNARCVYLPNEADHHRRCRSRPGWLRPVAAQRPGAAVISHAAGRKGECRGDGPGWGRGECGRIGQSRSGIVHRRRWLNRLHVCRQRLADRRVWTGVRGSPDAVAAGKTVASADQEQGRLGMTVADGGNRDTCRWPAPHATRVCPSAPSLHLTLSQSGLSTHLRTLPMNSLSLCLRTMPSQPRSVLEYRKKSG